MDDRPRTESHGKPARIWSRNGGRAMLIGLVAVVLAFFIGFFWQFYQATTVRQTLRGTEQELLVERLRVQLASAAIAAQGGDFEEARREMSNFFTRIQTEQWALPPGLRPLSDEFLAMRDDIITGLSRGRPEYGDVLYGMLQRFEEAAPRESQAPTAAPAALDPTQTPEEPH
jgi:hypothetical protein